MNTAHAVEGCCESVRPWTVRLGGPPVDGNGPAGYTGLVFTAANPCGATVVSSASRTEHPLRMLARWGGCVGDDTPGSFALIRASVLATSSGGGSIPTQDGCGADQLSAVAEVKIVVRSCNLPEPVIIDSDSEIVVPSGPVTIDVVAPDDWELGYGPSGPEENWTHVVLRVTACPCSCSYLPVGRLTEWLPYDEGAAAWGLVRPRRARRVDMKANNAAGGGVSVLAVWQRSQAGGNMGATTFTTNIANGSNLQIGAAAHVLVTSVLGGAGGAISAIWEIV